MHVIIGSRCDEAALPRNSRADALPGLGPGREPRLVPVAPEFAFAVTYVLYTPNASSKSPTTNLVGTS